MKDSLINQEDKKIFNIENIIKYLSIIGFTITVAGLLSLNIFFNEFNYFPIHRYLDWAEIALTQFGGGQFISVDFIVIYIALILFFNDVNNKAKISNYLFRVSFTIIGYVSFCLLIYTLIIELSYSYIVFKDYIFYAIFLFIFFDSILSIYKKRDGSLFNNFFNLSSYPNFRIFIIIIFPISFNIISIKKTSRSILENNIYNGTTVFTENDTIISTSTFKYIYKSNNFIFFYNTTDSTMSIIPMNNVIKIKYKFNNPPTF